MKTGRLEWGRRTAGRLAPAEGRSQVVQALTYQLQRASATVLAALGLSSSKLPAAAWRD